MKLFIFSLLVLILPYSQNLFGQPVYSPARLLQPLNDMGGSARAMAMGSAFVGVADDSSALLWNPAGLGALKGGELALHHNSWLVGTNQESFIAGFPVNGCGGFGLMATFMDYGTFQGRDSSGTLTSPYTADSFGLMLGWGMEFFPGFYAGLSAQDNQQFNPSQSYGVFSGGLGLLYLPDNHLRFGAALVNFGYNQSNAWVAAAIEGGVSYRQSLGKPHNLLLALDGTVEPQGVNRLGIGVEYSYQSKYFLRAGYEYSDQNNQIQDLQGLTAGAGLRLGDFQLDYAYLPYGDLGTSHRISLSYFFPATQTPTHPSVEAPAATFKPNPGIGTNQSVLTLQFDLPPDLVAQGRTLEAQGQMVQAMGLYEKELLQNNQDASAWYYLGADYYKLNQKANAVQCFEQVMKLRPSDKSFSDWLDRYKASQP